MLVQGFNYTHITKCVAIKRNTTSCFCGCGKTNKGLSYMCNIEWKQCLFSRKRKKMNTVL